MKLELRAPRDAEWKICRMLLPETFASVQSREYLLALREESPRLIGALSFRRQGDGLKDLRLHVVPRFRRAKAATAMLDALKSGSVRFASGYVDARREADGVSFCETAGLQRSDGLSTVEAEVTLARTYLQSLRARGVFPPGLRVVPISQAPLAEVARLQSRYIAHETDLNPWRARLAEMPELNRSLVAMLGERVVGILLWEHQGELGIIRSRVAETSPISKWVNLLLLSETSELMWSRGIRRVQFGYADDNRDTRRLAARFQSVVVAEIAEYTWRATQE